MDTDPSYLPSIYEKAKERAAQKLTGVRPPESQAQPTLPDIDKLKAEWIQEARQQILEEARKRRAAGGLAGGGGANPQTPVQRANPTQTERPLSPEEKLFEDIRGSGLSKDPLSAL